MVQSDGTAAIHQMYTTGFGHRHWLHYSQVREISPPSLILTGGRGQSAKFGVDFRRRPTLRRCHLKMEQIINSSAIDCLILLKLGTDLGHVTPDVPKTFKVEGQRSRSQLLQRPSTQPREIRSHLVFHQAALRIITSCLVS